MTFDEIYEAHHPRILGYFSASLVDPGRAEELTADTFMTLHVKLDAGTQIDPDKIGNWLAAVSRNHLRNEKKRLARLGKAERLVSEEMLLTIEEQDGEVGAPRIMDHFGPAPALTIEDAEFRVDHDRAVRALKPRLRDAYILTELRGLTSGEAADVLGDRDASTVRHQAIMARDCIKTALTGA